MLQTIQFLQIGLPAIPKVLQDGFIAAEVILESFQILF